jgi:hypothetical protein
VDDPVIGEHRRVASRIGEEGRVGGQDFEGCLRLDRPPQALLEMRTDLPGHVMMQHRPTVDSPPGQQR